MLRVVRGRGFQYQRQDLENGAGGLSACLPVAAALLI